MSEENGTNQEVTTIATETTTPPAQNSEVTQSNTETKQNESGGNEATPPVNENVWGDDWRQKYAGEDEKMLKRLERYASPKAALDALIEAQTKISSGKAKEPLKENPTPEELTQWRKDNGIPENPEGYEINPGDGVALSDVDKEIAKDFLKTAHEKNMKPEQVNGAIAWWYQQREAQIAEAQRLDSEHIANNTKVLKEEWGGDFERNLNILNSFLDSAPQGLKENFMQARMPNGARVGNDPDALRFLVGVAREINPTITVVPGSGMAAESAIQSEIEAFEKKIGDHSSDYWKGPNAEKNQARYLELIGAREGMKKRA